MILLRIRRRRGVASPVIALGGIENQCYLTEHRQDRAGEPVGQATKIVLLGRAAAQPKSAGLEMREKLGERIEDVGGYVEALGRNVADKGEVGAPRPAFQTRTAT